VNWSRRRNGQSGRPLKCVINGDCSRALYVTAIGRRVVVVRAFVKKTQKTPRSEIELALQRAKEVT
jgi:phage-related protein